MSLKYIKYCANIKVIANDRNFLLTDLVTCISQFKASLTGVNISVDQETLTATALISLMIEDKEHLWRCSKMCWYHMSGVCKDNDEAKWRLINKEREKDESNV